MLSRFSPSRGFRAAAFGVLLLCPSFAFAAQDAFPGADDRWKLYRSPNFELYSHASDRSSRELLEHLELVRAFFLQTVPLRERRPGEVTVFYFGNNREFQSYAPEKSADNLVGSFHAYHDRDIMSLAAGNGMEIARQVVQSHYVSHLFGLAGGKAPDWLRWGMGFLFSTVEASRSKVVFGLPDPYRRDQITKRKSFSCEWVFGVGRYVQKKEDRDIWQAHAWLFLHYLYLGQTAIPRERVDALVKALCEGTAGPNMSLEQRQKEMETLLGVSFTELDKLVEQYRRREIFTAKRLDLPPLAAPDTYQVEKLEAAEMRELLASLALRTRRSAEARLLLLHAADRPDVPPRVHEVLGQDALMDGNTSLAHERWTKAVQAGSENPAVFHNLGVIETQLWFRHFDLYFRLAPDVAERLRMLFLRSIKRTPTQTLAYETLAWVEATAPEPNIANVNLVQSKFGTLDNQSMTLLALSMVRLRMNDHASLAEMLESLEKGDRSPNIEAAVRQIRDLAKKRLAQAEKP